MPGVSEREISEAILKYLDTLPGGRATIDDLVMVVPSLVTLTADDMRASDTRPNEQIWEQRVRNIVSHKDSSGNHINLGYLQSWDGQLAITEDGKQHLKA